MMSVIADLTPIVADDRLARRNALVLSIAQALAGGNNTVIAATGFLCPLRDPVPVRHPRSVGVGAPLKPKRGKLATN